MISDLKEDNFSLETIVTNEKILVLSRFSATKTSEDFEIVEELDHNLTSMIEDWKAKVNMISYQSGNLFTYITIIENFNRLHQVNHLGIL